ncbi:hypothetical protein PHYPSEUDO_003498 [Phytophthora pseudosyringae]|uniref:Myb-like DNA-binding protein n=1 Tax=Phytophthora pseudosyringae TaxID=221518 RepID=A0A8T1VUD3_9STRA|nr:hypothetical protein PHYPSEUDO_003498 [Phytophthora pseudosyringae]
MQLCEGTKPVGDCILLILAFVIQVTSPHCTRTSSVRPTAILNPTDMTITPRVQSQYFQKDQELIRLAPNQDQTRSLPTKRAGTPWSLEEHELFLEALECYPSGPWKTIAAHIGTRTTRQTMTHAQKYREKIARRRKAEAAASPTNRSESEILVANDNPRPAYETSQAYNLAMTAASNIPDANQVMKHEGEFMDSHGQFVAQEGELELDDSVIALLETFEPLEMMSALEP